MDKQPLSMPMLLIAGGLVLIFLGLIYWAFQGRLGWIGRLPGDIRVEKETFSFYMPITTMVLFSILFSVLLRLGTYFMGFFK